MSSIAWDLDFGLRAWGLQARMVGRHADLDEVARTVRGLLERMDAGSADAPPHVSGNRSELAWTTELPEAAGWSGKRRADVALLVPDRHQLVLRAAPHLHAAMGAKPVGPATVVLLDNVRALRLSYRSPLRSDGGWLDSWQRQYRPRLVAMHLDFQPGDARQWPDIVAAPAQDRPRP